jgi:hypothetical protein
VRVEIFRAFIRCVQLVAIDRGDHGRQQQLTILPPPHSNDKLRLGIDRYSRSSPKYATTIRRHKVAEDGYAQLNAIGAGMKGTVAITFVDQWGQEEAGIDGGGVFKEFLTSLSTEVFNTDRGLWQATKQQELYPSPTQYATESHQLNWYQFIGRVLGKALYEGILADVSFAGFFLKKWLGRRTDLNDLASLDRELYDGLIKLKQFEGNVEELALTFTLDVDDFGVTETVELVPNGAKCVGPFPVYRTLSQLKKPSRLSFRQHWRDEGEPPPLHRFRRRLQAERADGPPVHGLLRCAPLEQSERLQDTDLDALADPLLV